MADSIMAKIAVLESLTLPTEQAVAAHATAVALAATLAELKESIIEFQWAVHRTLGEAHPARHEVTAPAEEARGWTAEAQGFVTSIVEALERLNPLFSSALQRRDALVVTLRM